MSDRERELIDAVEDTLACLGTADGYIPSIGAPRTRRLQRALVTPEYGRRIFGR